MQNPYLSSKMTDFAVLRAPSGNASLSNASDASPVSSREEYYTHLW